MGNFNSLIEDRARTYFSQATDEEYKIYLTDLCNNNKIFMHEAPVFIGGYEFEANKAPEPEPIPATKAQ
jgi:hypothetical protein